MVGIYGLSKSTERLLFLSMFKEVDINWATGKKNRLRFRK